MIASIYARKSTSQDGVSDEARSVTRQIEQAKAYAARRGWFVCEEHIYSDDGVSGAEFERRAGFVRLMTAVAGNRRPPFQVMIMSEPSRLGREMVETSYALKQILDAGVRVFYYLDDREATLDGPTDKILLAVAAFADELERDKARQRTSDALQRKARAGHVTGGACFGYDNLVVETPDGRRSHVERRVNEVEAAVVRRIFEMARDGLGKAAIAKRLNADGAPSPRAQQGRPRAWSQSSVYEVLFRLLYRGEIVYNQTRKRQPNGKKRQSRRPQSEWITLSKPELRIVPDDLWSAAHARLDASRGAYLRSTKGRLWGRPSGGSESKYLLTGLGECPTCGGLLMVVSRATKRRGRELFYTCNNHRRRGETVCEADEWIPLDVADELVLDTLADDFLRPEVVNAALDRALGRILASRGETEGQRARLRERLTTLDSEVGRLTDSLAGGVAVTAIADALTTREAERQRIREELAALDAVPSFGALDRARILEELEALRQNWHEVLDARLPAKRQVVRTLLKSRARLIPETRNGVRGLRVEAEGTLRPLLRGEISVQKVASPTGFEPVF